MSDASMIERPVSSDTEPAPSGAPAAPVLATVRTHLGRIAANVHAIPPAPGEDDAFRMGRGVTISLMLVAPFWIAVGIAFWMAVR